jgi:NAD-dependent deacetylase
MQQIQQLKEMIRQSENIVFLGGAGVSTESGIPDFRSEKGVYNTVREYGVTPETILSAGFFHQDTEIFYDYYKKYMLYPQAQPNEAHKALARLEQQGKLKAVVTQNIDGLHQAAGSKRVFELHGSVLRNNCTKCGKFYSLEEIMAREGVPHCSCGGVIKPDVVLYGEPLDAQVLKAATLRIDAADMLIIGGTSLTVYPAAGLADYFRGNRLVVINRSATHGDSRAALVIRRNIGEVLAACVE